MLAGDYMTTGNQTPSDVASRYSALAFTIQQALSKVSTLTLVRVVDCTNDGGIVPVGTVTVQPLVNLVAGDGQAIQHAPLYKLPYCRIAGGRNAVIIDPEPGDIGLAGFCSRDISAVKTAKDIANPGSFRLFDMADGVYITTCLGTEAPLQYIVANADGIAIVSPTEVRIEAPLVRIVGELQQTDGDASFEQNVEVGDSLTAQTEVTAGTIALTQHTHGGVTPGGGNTAPPNP